MLTVREVTALLDLLAQLDQTLESSAAAFQRAFLRAEHFRVGSAICCLIEDGLLPAKQRPTALFILHDLYKSDPPGVHPFMPFLVGLLQTPPVELKLHERNLLCQLVSTSPGAVAPCAKQTPAELAIEWPAGGDAHVPPNLAALRASFAERDMQVPAARRVGISPLVPDSQPLERMPANGGANGGGGAAATGAAVGSSGAPADDSSTGASDEGVYGTVYGIEQQLGLLRLEPTLLRPPPPLLDSKDEEILWLTPHADHSFDVLWDRARHARAITHARATHICSHWDHHTLLSR